ncbi:MAG: aspartate carbamoyltransferase regulatory subunit [Lentimicrobiaceae bacterium]|nr:aspartate carbamoyltransferase regulatory subunit [Lentimicrobiaceae bacterium]
MKVKLSVSAIENGTVIDHIPATNVFRVIRILNLEFDTQHQLLFGDNLRSQKYGKKGLIKVSDKFFEDKEINKIAIVAPTATIIEIRNYEVVSKKQVEVPNEIINIARCVNPNCITNIENITPHLRIIDSKEMRLQCHYCEKITTQKNLSFI